ncbi:hypothetical protein BC828DRAFT_54453 [Blastocladiella britannica]|nr:hypothetical protein BC828DRAFT_54453 [Blastocladiella britannica]
MPRSAPTAAAGSNHGQPHPLVSVGALDNRIHAERIWADRVDRELRAHRDYYKHWGFMVPKPASPRTPFGVVSVLRPPSVASKTAGPTAVLTAANQHADETRHRVESVYRSAYTRAVHERPGSTPIATMHSSGQTKGIALPARYAALPNTKDVRRQLRAAAAVATAASGAGSTSPRASTRIVPMTTTAEYGHMWLGAPALERFGSTSADARRNSVAAVPVPVAAIPTAPVAGGALAAHDTHAGGAAGAPLAGVRGVPAWVTGKVRGVTGSAGIA